MNTKKFLTRHEERVQLVADVLGNQRSELSSVEREQLAKAILQVLDHMPETVR